MEYISQIKTEKNLLKMINKLIEVRKEKKKKNPKFKKQSSHKKIRLKNKWRKPRGSDSKIRICKKGYPRKVKSGYRSPALLRDKSTEGKNIIKISNIKSLNNVNKETDIIEIGKVGQRKKIEIVKECINKGYLILNLKDAKKFLSDAENTIKKKREAKDKKVKAKKKKIAEEKDKKEDKKSEKKEDQKDGIEGKIEKEEKEKKTEKKEKDKLLIKREL